MKKFNKLTKLQKAIIIIIAVILALIFINIGYHIYYSLTVRDATRERAIVKVALISAKSGPTTQEIVLPGNIEAWHEATIYARTNGYVKRWLVDIGDRVKKGDLLAEIETPELDAQLRQAQADVETAEVDYEIALITAKRWQELLPLDAVSKQDTDQKISDAMAAETQVIAAIANRDRLQQLVDFEKVIAPFDGIISNRTTDIGDLIDAGSDTKVSLFEMVQADKLRIYVRVPQNYAALITPDLNAQLQVAQYPNKKFPAKLLKNASAINGDSRTLLLEFVADNPSNELFAGSYAKVSFSLPVPSNVVRVPINTLLFRAEGLQVGTIDGNNRVILKHVTIGRDFGDYVEIVSGISVGEQIIINPPDSLVSDQKVEIVASEDKKGLEAT